MRKVIRFLLWLAAACVLVYAAVNLTAYIQESSQSSTLNKNLIDSAVVIKNPTPSSLSEAAGTILEQEAEPHAEQHPAETAPIEVDFSTLAEQNRDIIGWLYSEDTPINLPVVQSEDNSYYLQRMFDGTGNGSGTLFADYRNSGDFSDNSTIIYGHNMKNKEMFGTLSSYKEQSYFDEHPVMWLLTPDTDYKIELVAGFVTSTSSDVYAFERSEEDIFITIQQAVEKSDFRSNTKINLGDRFLILSTCSYEYDNARYVLIGRLIPLEDNPSF